MQRSDSINKCSSKFALAAVVLIVTVSGWVHSADAQIIYTPVNVRIDNDSYNLDVNNDGVADFTIRSTEVKFCTCQHGGCWHTDYIAEVPVSGNGVMGKPPTPLTLGHEIGPKQTFYGGLGYLVYNFQFCGKPTTVGGKWLSRNGKTAYLGFSFQIKGETYYGWAELTDYGFSTELTGYAYEATPGKALTAGQTQ